MGQFSVTIYGATGSVLSDIQQKADKVMALIEAGVAPVLVMEQLGISKASYYRCLQNAA